MQRSANREAINHLTKGLELLKALTETPERARQEFRLQIALGGPLIATKGQGAPEVGHVYTRARELCLQLGDTLELFPVLQGLCLFHFARAEYQMARGLAGECLTLAQSAPHPVRLLLAHAALGYTSYYLGEFAPAREYLERAMALYDPQQLDPHVFGVQDRRITCLLWLSWILWFLGYPDQAFRRSQELLAVARESPNLASLAVSLYGATRLHQYCRERRLMYCMSILPRR